MNFRYLDKETITSPFFTAEFCDYLIEKFEEYGWTIDENGIVPSYTLYKYASVPD